MLFYDKPSDFAIEHLNSNKDRGLTSKTLSENVAKYGKNALTEKEKTPLIKEIFKALSEPMLIILLFSFMLTFGINLGKFFKTGDGDFSECVGILIAIVLSVSITLIMEGSSKKAFSALNSIYDNLTVKVIRGGETVFVRREYIAVGDIVCIESGDKIVADGRLIESTYLSVDESALTGESRATEKDAEVVLKESSPLAERKNSVYSGTYVVSGSGKYIVTAIGDGTEIGNIARELKNKKEEPSPLNYKLSKLGKTITVIGVSFAVVVFIISLVKMILSGTVSFSGVQSLFVSCVILIVAAVPEGLPTIVAVSLALNMIKHAKENALIKKMVATETAGAVSVICSDKTGTLTENKMTLESFCGNEFCSSPENIESPFVLYNFICNSTADVSKKGNEFIYHGSGTECALISAYMKKGKREDYVSVRKNFPVIKRDPFSNEKKMMSTTVLMDGKEITFIKGAPEKVLPACNLSKNQIDTLLSKMGEKQKTARRVLCFAHRDGNLTVYDGYAVLCDGIRKEVKDAVNKCATAGIKIKILTGDNYLTAYAVARELKVAVTEREVINGQDLEKLSDEELKKILPKISVISRSTPLIKLRVVKALKSMGEVVAVTGDGINDAPAIKHADVGIAMGKSGSEITKEAADIVLLDDSFASIVRAVSFGRNVYRNLQRFILFQLSVNVSALLFITVVSIFGLNAPFNTLQLLWINVIMDGPPAITLGLESAGDKLMTLKPVKRNKSIVSAKMLFRIIFNGVFVSLIMCLQYFRNILCVNESEKTGTVFTLFISFQLFNAFNSRELGSDSIFVGFGKNRIMVMTFLCTFIIQIFIVQVAYSLFGVNPLSLLTWIKILFTASSIILVSETFKLFYKTVVKGERIFGKTTVLKKIKKYSAE